MPNCGGGQPRSFTSFSSTKDPKLCFDRNTQTVMGWLSVCTPLLRAGGGYRLLALYCHCILLSSLALSVYCTTIIQAQAQASAGLIGVILKNRSQWREETSAGNTLLALGASSLELQPQFQPKFQRKLQAKFQQKFQRKLHPILQNAFAIVPEITILHGARWRDPQFQQKLQPKFQQQPNISRMTSHSALLRFRLGESCHCVGCLPIFLAWQEAPIPSDMIRGQARWVKSSITLLKGIGIRRLVSVGQWWTDGKFSTTSSRWQYRRPIHALVQLQKKDERPFHERTLNQCRWEGWRDLVGVFGRWGQQKWPPYQDREPALTLSLFWVSSSSSFSPFPYLLSPAPARSYPALLPPPPAYAFLWDEVCPISWGPWYPAIHTCVNSL